jgi:hypothetical protein
VVEFVVRVGLVKTVWSIMLERVVAVF